MWIMLTKKVPTEVSPPKLSIFWSIPWPDDHYAPEQGEVCQECGMPVMKEKKTGRTRREYCICPDGPVVITAEEPYVHESVWSIFGVKSPNWVGARKIHYKDEDIRVFPHEFSILKKENMSLYVLGYNDIEPSHIFVPGSVASENIQKAILEGDMKHIYDAALVDGATPAQAMAVAQEIDITLPDPDFPPTGWYRCKKEYAEIYCDEWEMKD